MNIVCVEKKANSETNCIPLQILKLDTCTVMYLKKNMLQNIDITNHLITSKRF